MQGIESKAKGALAGIAIGDALGATLEFMTRDEILHKYGIHKEIIGGGYWQLAPGEVTDDTDMTIAVAKGIIAKPNNPLDQIAHYFTEWVNTEPKDIGNICRLVLTEGIKRGIKKEEDWLEIAEYAHKLSGGRSGGNGSLMRTIPVVLAYFSDKEKMFEIAYRQSALTHYDHLVGKCVISYCDIVRDILLGGNIKDVILKNIKNSPFKLDINLALGHINTSGYVAHTLEAALNCAYQTESFEQALLMAVNLGGDTDTIGAVTGGIAGASYGLENIPLRWLDKLIIKNEILFLADQLLSINSKH